MKANIILKWNEKLSVFEILNKTHLSVNEIISSQEMFRGRK